LLHKDAGQKGSIEQKWGIDIVLQEADYDTCITMYGTNIVDAVCITNMDTLAPALRRGSVAVLPTSTSDGADACIVVGINSVDDLAGKKTWGLEKSVSQYTFERNLELQGKDPAQFTFQNMDPAAAAQAMQTNQANIESIVVWNPFLLQTLRTRSEAKTLFDSTTIPEEIIDMVVVAKDVLQRPGGESFACAVIDTFYEVNKLLASRSDGDETLVALGKKFSNLGLEDMRIVVQQTKFYKTPADAKALFEKVAFQQETMPRVVDFCASHGIVDQKPTVGFGDPSAQLNFDTRYIDIVNSSAAGQTPPP
jgi:NitT/TauT family transport system substrate-binding protein